MNICDHTIREKYFKSKTVIQYKEQHYIMTKVAIYQENIVIMNMYGPRRTTKCMKKTERIEGKNKNIIIVQDFYTLLSVMNRMFWQKIKKETEGLK